MRVVLDTDVIVAALRSPTGASRQLLLAGVESRITLVISAPLLLQYESVLKRAEHLTAARATADDIDIVLDQIAAAAEATEIHYLWRPRLTDYGDDLVLEAAVNGRADVLASFNVKDFAPVIGQFGIALSKPGDLWRIVTKET
jgi:putative PIN family toxin of toxin-antitoxin system